MALVVEDGSGRSDAESYLAVADADTYHSNRANAAWAALTTPNKEAYLRRATEYMIQMYRMLWKGTRGSSTQALDWPRALVERPDFSYAGLNGYTTIGGEFYFPSDEVPVEVQRACAELALKASTQTLAADIGRSTKREKVGELEVEYMDSASPYIRFRAIDLMLAPFLASTSLVRVTRA